MYLGFVQTMNPKPGKDDTPMRASEALTFEAAACWQRLQQSKEFFFEDLEAQMKEHQILSHHHVAKLKTL